jgi:hypothetical protein
MKGESWTVYICPRCGDLADGHGEPVGCVNVACDSPAMDECQVQRVPDLDLLRKLWNLSQHDRMIIWIAGEIQDLVMDALETDEPTDAEDLLFSVARAAGEQDA